MPDRLTAVIADVLRDQLAWDWNGEPGDPDSSCGQAGHMPSGSEVIDELAAEVAAAIRDDQTVRTVDELEALPAGTILQTDNGGVWERLATDSRYCWSLRGGRHGWDYNADMLARYAAPLVILYRPDQEVGGA